MVKPSEPGVRKCMRCGWLFVSPDILRVARCQDCKQGDAAYSPRETSQVQVSAAIRANSYRE